MQSAAGETEDFILTREKLNDTIKYPWFKKDYESYKPKSLSWNSIRDNRKHLSFIVIGGSWCDDTHLWLPKFLKTIEGAGVRQKNIRIYGVDRDKKFPGSTRNKTAPETDYKVDRVPVFIVLYKDKEIGRITESVRNSVEDDILQILKDAELNSLKK